MRTEEEMLDLILQTARDDERVRAVILNGSRANPHAPRDIFQDFDIVYLVTETASFRRDPGWIDRFGKRMILQLPDEMGASPAGEDERYCYLIQLADGNRIDLTIYPLAKLNEMEADSLSVLLLDKDQLVPPFPPPSERGYLPAPPSAKQFADCCNEFWWVSPYAAKGLWRGQLPYARYILDILLRKELLKMLTWYVGVKSGFQATAGAYGKYLQKRLEPPLWELLLRTYAGAGVEDTWEALFAIGQLFRQTAGAVAAHCGYEYPRGDDERVTAHLRHVRALPRDAKTIY